MTIEFGIIGGSGFYKPISDSELKLVKTPFGSVSVYTTTMGGKDVAFIARHGEGHSSPPHLVNYRANIFALYKLGVKRILSSSAVGSMLEEVKPGSFVVPDQFIDFTTERKKTYFDGKFEVTLHNGTKRGGVVHIDVSSPYCPDLRMKIIESGKKANFKIFETGVYVCTEGPRFETPAEITAYKTLGGTLVGMTSASESVLARELGICYATVCIVTNYAAGMQERISVEEVFEMFNEKLKDLRKIIDNTLKLMDTDQINCNCLGT
jgi:5'-methylthioadenosine phosphorylase